MSTETPVRKRRLKRATARALGIGAMVGVLAVVLVGLTVMLYSRHARQSAAELQLARELVASELAGRLERAFRTPRQQLAAVAADPAAQAAVVNDDPSARQAAAADHAPRFEHLLRLRLLPADTSDVDDAGPAPLTYASLDMLNRARQHEFTLPAEVHLHGTDRAHVVIIERMRAPGSGELIGFAHASFSLTLVERALAELDRDGAYVELRQVVPGSAPLVLARSGDGAPAPAAEAATQLVPGTAWSVAFWGEPGADVRALARERLADTAAQEIDLPVLPLGAAVAVLALLAAGLVSWRRRTGRRGGDAAVYQGAVKAIMEGAHPGLERLVPGLTASTPAPARTVDAPAGDDSAVPAAAPAPAAAGSDADADTETFFFDEAGEEPAPAAPEPEGAVPAVIFRTYDIRGVVGETLSSEIVRAIGCAIGTEAYERGQQGIVVGRDGRQSSPELAEALIEGLRESGRDVIDIGLSPTPVLYFATHYLDTASGVMLTGSHNPPEYNGLKIVLDGETLAGDAIQKLRRRIVNGDFASGAGSVQSAEILPEYIRRVTEDVPVALGSALKIVVDCGNGVAGAVAPALLRALGHDVIELYCEVDGSFPNHHPDPSQPDNLADLIDMVQLENADVGFAFDGDGDRLGVVDGEGRIIWPDRQMILFARDVLSRNPGAQIIFDVKCSRHLAEAITAAGGEALMSQTGHSLIKARMRETGALLAGEMSGHIFFKERWYGFDDALYTAARLTEILVREARPAAQIFAELPGGVATPELRLDMPEAEHAAFMQRLVEAADFADATISTIDGLRADFADGWGLVRPSNTTPCLVLRFEGDDQAALARVKARFRELLLGLDPDLALPF